MCPAMFRNSAEVESVQTLSGSVVRGSGEFGPGKRGVSNLDSRITACFFSSRRPPQTLLKDMDHRTDLVERTRAFALNTLKFCTSLPAGGEIGLIKRQLLGAATSVGANYRAARRAKSRRDLVAKLSIVEEEADECIYWFDLLSALVDKRPTLKRLSDEADQIVAMMVASKKTIRNRGL